MRLLLVIAALCATVACGGKKKNSAYSETLMDPRQDFAPGFIDLTDETDEDLDMLMGSELMVASAHCGNLLALEPAALMGRLNEGEIRCLEDGYRMADRQTAKKKVSLVLMADAWNKGDTHRWETIVRRHLEEVDQSDPNLCYKFALFLGRQGPEVAEETMRWVDTALENRSRFPAGDTHVARVYGLLKLKSHASAKHWAFLEEQYILTPSADMLEQRDEARNEAKNLAREWLEYARNAGKDETLAYQLCVSAAGGREFCEQL